MIPWHEGRHLVSDATVLDTLASSYVQATTTAEIAKERN